MAALQEVNIDAAVASVKSETEFSQMGKKANHGTKSFSWWKGVFDLLQRERGTFLQPTVRSGRFVESPAEYLSLSTFCLNATLGLLGCTRHEAGIDLVCFAKCQTTAAIPTMEKNSECKQTVPEPMC